MHVTPLGGSGEHLGWCLSLTERMTGCVTVSGCLSCCLWGACLTMSVKETASLLDVGSLPASPVLEIVPFWPPGMGHLPLPQWFQLLCTAVSSHVLLGPVGPGAPQQLTFPADMSRLLSLEGRGGWCRQLGTW